MTNEAKAKLGNKAKWILAALLMAAPALAESADIAAAQPVDLPALQQPSTAPKRRILVSIRDRKLALLEGDRLVKVYPVAVGAKVSPSPTGEFKIVNRVVKPTYYQPGTVIASGPRNPLGSRWIGLNQKSYGIHGTNAPRSIGKAASHGCIRMAKADLEELFEQVRAGDTVEIRGAADAQTAAIFGSAAPATVVAAETGTPSTEGQ
jgi:lipoprotein-anchoring transpeptidase ErfK/SrfK